MGKFILRFDTELFDDPDKAIPEILRKVAQDIETTPELGLDALRDNQTDQIRFNESIIGWYVHSTITRDKQELDTELKLSKPFSKWLRRLSLLVDAQVKPEAFREYYENGMTPEQAIEAFDIPDDPDQ